MGRDDVARGELTAVEQNYRRLPSCAQDLLVVELAQTPLDPSVIAQSPVTQERYASHGSPIAEYATQVALPR